MFDATKKTHGDNKLIKTVVSDQQLETMENLWGSTKGRDALEGSTSAHFGKPLISLAPGEKYQKEERDDQLVTWIGTEGTEGPSREQIEMMKNRIDMYPTKYAQPVKNAVIKRYGAILKQEEEYKLKAERQLERL